MWKRIQVKYLLFVTDFNETWIFSTDFRKQLKHQVLSKSVQWEQSFRAGGRTDGRTDMKLTVAFRSFSNAPENIVEINFMFQIVAVLFSIRKALYPSDVTIHSPACHEAEILNHLANKHF
jgi:hypothetical protein